MCGNHWFDSAPWGLLGGSPPRVREPQFAHTGAVSEARITPACAGTTIDSLVARFIFEDHPRVCGNHPEK